MTDTKKKPTLADTAVVSKSKVAATRIQLRWENDEQSPGRYICQYELVIALDEGDVRRERRGPRGGRKPDRVSQVVALGQTSRGSTREPCYMPCAGELLLSYDAPYRDGAHALFDAEKLGGLPVYVVTIDGLYLTRVATPVAGVSPCF